MRKIDPDVECPFRVPLVPVTPILGIRLRLLLMFSLPAANWLRLLAWLAIGLVIDSVSGPAGIALWPPNALSPERIDASILKLPAKIGAVRFEGRQGGRHVNGTKDPAVRHGGHADPHRRARGGDI